MRGEGRGGKGRRISPPPLVIDDHGLAVGVPFIASPNCDARPGGCPVSLVVIHHISLPPGVFGGTGIVDLFTNRLDPAAHPYYATIEGATVSAHFLIRRGGNLVQFVPCGARAWHAGESAWKGRARCNDFSIGVELEGTGEAPFTAAQYRQLARLTRALKARYPIRDIVGHSDIAPGRKSDPGPHFEWRRYRALMRKRSPRGTPGTEIKLKSSRRTARMPGRKAAPKKQRKSPR